MVKTASGANGTYLVGPSGRALYLWVADSGGKSNCSSACASAWPPLTTTGTPTASGGAQASDLGTISRSDGTKQVTYMGHPLYYFVGDPSAGSTTGQGNNGFGAKWWLVAPSGAAITSAGSGSSSSSSSSGYGY
jgi:predicted lipoprotein with Yx(FWY)xxD motif